MSCAIKECNRNQRITRGMCQTHYGRWLKHGSPMVVKNWIKPSRQQLKEMFWSKVKKTSSCWLWLGCQNNYGYGKFYGQAAHRFCYELCIAAIPKKLHVLHQCDVRNCVRPTHLFLGTQKDNNIDMAAKGRSARGERNGGAKLKNADVRTIRHLHSSGTPAFVLADKFHVTSGAISMILLNKTWDYAECN